MIAISKIRGRVRGNLMDLDGRMAAPTGVQIDATLADVYIELAAQLPSPMLYVASAFTIAAGANTFTFPVTVTSSGFGTGTTEYAGEARIQLAVPGTWLRKITSREMDAFMYGVNAIPLAIPDRFALYQDGSQVIRGRCWPGSNEARACNLWATIKADDLRDYVGTGGAEGFDTVSAPLSREAAAALVLKASSRLLKRMGAEDVAKRGINPAVAGEWDAAANDLLYAEEAAQHSVRSTGRIQRWKS